MGAEKKAFQLAIAANPDDMAPRWAYADWLREHDDPLGHVLAAQIQRGLPYAPLPVRDIALGDLVSDHSWREAFGQGTGGNCEQKADACPPGADVDLTPPNIEDVAEVIAASNGANDEEHWVGLFRMKDGRIALVDAWCDYTGWD